MVLNSKEVAEFKLRLGLPSGNKKQIIKFPEELESFDTHLLRGLADTDFTVNFRDLDKDGKKEHPRICASFANKNFVTEISKILDKFGFNYHKRELFTHGKYNEYRIELEGKYNFNLWMEKIGFSNPKHINKINNRFNNRSFEPKLDF